MGKVKSWPIVEKAKTDCPIEWASGQGKHWSKFITCSPSPGNYGGVSRPQRHLIMFFDYAQENGYLKILIC